MSVDEVAEVVVPVAEERLSVTKRVMETGHVRVSLKTQDVTETVRDVLHGRRVEIEHVPINREVDCPPLTREENGVLVVPVVEEILVVEKRLVLKEELRIRYVDTEEAVELPVKRRVQTATVIRAGNGELPLPPDPDTDPPEFPPTIAPSEK